MIINVSNGGLYYALCMNMFVIDCCTESVLINVREIINLCKKGLVYRSMNVCNETALIYW